MRAALITLLAALAFAAPAHASIVFERGTNKISIYVANDDGSGARRLVAGTSPVLSADGQTVIYTAKGDTTDPQLREIPTAGGASKLLLEPVRYGAFAWSPDGRYVAAETGPLDGKHALVLLDRTTGSRYPVAAGYLQGASFSPAGDKVVYALAHSSGLFASTDLYVAPAPSGSPTALTRDGRSIDPVWGPQKIAYTHWKRPPRRQDGPKYDLRVMAPDGTGVVQLTHDKVPFLLSGLIPVDWSADGTRLLAQFGGQDTAYVVTVDPVTGAERVIGTKSEGFIASGLSADGSTILGSSGGSIFASPAHVVTAPYAGGRTTALTRGQSPSWNR